MSEHIARIEWQIAAGDDFTGRRYSRRHEWHFDGGAVVAGSSSPHVVRLPFSDPAAVDPEEAFVASLSSCHMLWFLDLAARAGWAVERYTDEATGHMAPDADGKSWLHRIVLRPVVTLAAGSPRDETAHAELHHRAHEQCFIARSMRSEVICEPRLAG
jgi:organic hydroperoxide reductase OsmC/OhrA